MATTLIKTPYLPEGTNAVPTPSAAGAIPAPNATPPTRKAVAVGLVERRTGISDIPMNTKLTVRPLGIDKSHAREVASSRQPAVAADLVAQRTGVRIEGAEPTRAVRPNTTLSKTRAMDTPDVPSKPAVAVHLTTARTGVLDTGEATECAANLSLVWHAATHRGLVRRQNEDSLCALTSGEDGGAPRYLLAVADGLGGHRSGFLASKMALEVMRRQFREWRGGSTERFVSTAVRRANEEVFSAAFTRPEFSDMQTTITAAALEKGHIVIGHVGDCRLYRLRDGRMDVLTRDHTKAGRLVQMRAISSEEAKQHPDRHRLTRSLGAQPFVRVDVFKEEVANGDVYLLCSDGLWSNLPDEEIGMALHECQPEAACKELFAQALKDGGADNLSAVVFRISYVGPTKRRLSWRSLFRVGR